MYSNLLCFFLVFTLGFDAAASNPTPKVVSIQKLIEGDIREDPKQRNAWKTARLWINGEVPYVIAPELSANHRRVILEAVQAYKDKTCIRLIPKTDQHTDYIRFMNGGDGKCNSAVGRSIGGQNLSMGRGCDDFGVAIHELMHGLGFNHEHVRPDRNNYVKVHFDRLQENTEWIYTRKSPFGVNLQNLRYDYLSLMHYTKDGFSTGGDTIETLDKAYYDKIGNKRNFSVCDLEKINRLYECKDYILPDNPCKDTQPSTAEAFQNIESIMHGKVLNVAGGSASSGAHIILYQKQSATSQNDHFAFKKVDNEYFYIESAISPDMVLDIEGASTEPGAQVILMLIKDSADPAAKSQLWRWNGQAIQSALGDLVLSVKDSNAASGTSCVTESYSGKSNQLWLGPKVQEPPLTTPPPATTPPTVAGFQMIESLMHGKVLNAAGGYADPGTRIILYQKQGANSVNDRFMFKQGSNGYFSIVSSVDPNMVFDIEGGDGAKAGAQVILMPLKNPAVNSQLWRWNGQAIQSALGDLVLNVAGSSTSNGAACVVNPRSGVNNNELWRLSN